MIAALFALLSLLAAPSPPAGSAAPPPCRFHGEPREWTGQALAAWDRLDAERLLIAQPVTPAITLFDARCVYRLTPALRGDFSVGRRAYRTEAAPHGGRIPLPDGTTVPATRLAFASPVSNGDMFFIMALPSLWRADPAERRDPRLLSMVVFMHEFTHTQQADGLGGRVDDLIARGLAEDANDDIVQARFSDRPGYRAAWEVERDRLYAAARAPDAATARESLAEALNALSTRQSRWFTGDDRLFSEADDLFLTMEGTGNWSAWAWLTDPRGGRLSSADAIEFVRGGRTQWSQDEGLGLMLAIDRLTPDWPRYAFGSDALTADEMARRAVR